MEKVVKQKEKFKIKKSVFIPSAAVTLFFVLLGLLFPVGFASGAAATLSWVLDKFTWFYAIGATFLLVFCFWAGFSKYGKIRLGGPKAKPELGSRSWFFISLCAGIATGIVFWGVAEPMSHFTNPPAFLQIAGSSIQSGEVAVSLCDFHWTLHTYGIYVSCALCMAFFYYNSKQPFLCSTGMYGLIGDKIHGPWGRTVDAISIFAILGGIGTSYGFGIQQIASGMNFLWGTPETNFTYLGVVCVITAAYVCSSYTGLHKGIKFLSNFNVGLYIFLLVFLVLLGPTIYLLNGLVESIGTYIASLPRMSFRTDFIYQTGWSGSWSIFYWAWWLAYAPIVGLFFVRCAYGRTIREFVVVNLLLPSAFGLVWFAVFGNAGIYLDLFENGNIANMIAEYGNQVSMFALFDEFPLSGLTCAVAMLAVAISFITLSDSMTSTIAMMSTDKDFTIEEGERAAEKMEAPPKIKIFWGILMGAMAYMLLTTGGATALQSSVIACGLPILVIQLLMAAGYIRAMKHINEYDLVSSPELIRELMKVEGLNAAKMRIKRTKNRYLIGDELFEEKLKEKDKEEAVVTG